MVVEWEDDDGGGLSERRFGWEEGGSGCIGSCFGRVYPGSDSFKYHKIYI
jgi:hypothetical protein